MPWSAGNPPPTWTNAQILAQLGGANANGGATYFWQGSTITYSFPTSTSPFTSLGESEASGYSVMSAAQQAKAVIAFALWDELIAPSITQTSANAGQITIANSTNMGGSYSYASTWMSSGPNRLTNAHVWLNTTYNSGGNSLTTPTIGAHGFSTYIHEIGHALGFEHMGAYNGSGNATTEATSIQDSTVYSIMSYFGPSWGTGAANGEGIVAWADWIGADGKTYDPQTPMLNDVLAAQNFYGADTTTRTGNTVYGFNSTLAGVDGGIYDFAQNAHPIICIYDASGNDTLDLSGYTTASRIDLNAGAFSDSNDMTKNISIAYSAVIENAVGGSGNDSLTGNAVANILNGGGGDDTLIGGGGADSFIGGTGIDTVSYANETAGLTIDMTTVANSTGNAAGDTFNTVEIILGSSLVDTISGTSGNETLNGGGGNDTLNGRAGNDTIDGGAGTGDIAVFAGNFAGYAFNYNSGTATYTVYNPDGSIDTVTNVENFQFADGTRSAAQLPIITGVPQRHVNITNLNTSQNEGNSGTTTYTFQITLDGTVYGAQTVNYAIAGTGANPTDASDFTGATSGTLTFAVGETVKTVTITVVGDTTAEQTETFALTLSGATAGLVIDTASSTSTIVNDDASIINGTAGDNTLIGTAGADQINGLGGNDYFDGNGGNDVLTGGTGNDTVVYRAGLIAANVNMAGGTDTLLVNGGALPTGFDLAASSIEKVTWIQTDSTNQSWSTIVNSYDNAWRMTQSTTNYDNGTHIDTFYDVAGATNYQNLRNDFNAANGHTASYYLFDDNTRSEIFFDAGNVANYQNTQNDFNAGNQQTASHYLLDNGTRSDTYFDVANTQNYQYTRADYDAQNRMTFSSYLLDNGIISQTHYDAANTQNYVTSRSDVDTQGRTTFATTLYDSGVRSDISFDVNNTLNYQYSRGDFDSQNRLIYNVYLMDDGTLSQTYTDAANAFNYITSRSDVDVGGNTTFASTVYDNGTRSDTYYDVGNQQSWNTATYNYDAQLNLLNIVYT